MKRRPTERLCSCRFPARHAWPRGVRLFRVATTLAVTGPGLAVRSGRFRRPVCHRTNRADRQRRMPACPGWLPPGSRWPRCSRLPVRGPYPDVRLLPLPGRCLGGRVRVVSGFRPQTGPMRDDPAGTCLPVSPARAARAGLTGWRAVPCRSRPSGLAVPAGMLPCGLVPVEHASGMPCRPLPAGRAGTGRKSDSAPRKPAASGHDGGVVR